MIFRFHPDKFDAKMRQLLVRKKWHFSCWKPAIGKLNDFYYFSSCVAIKANYYSVFSGFVALFSCLTVFNSNKFSRQIFLTLAPNIDYDVCRPLLKLCDSSQVRFKYVVRSSGKVYGYLHKSIWFHFSVKTVEESRFPRGFR